MSLALKLALSPVLAWQALRTRARTPRLPEASGEREGEVGSGGLLRLLVAGDSSAAGVGVAYQRDALAEPLAVQLAQVAGVTVRWRLVAASGLSTAGLVQRLQSEAWPRADLVVVVTGVNDVVEQVPSGRAVAAREMLANSLRNAAGVRHVAFAPVPPIHRFPALPQPLRAVMGRDAQRHNRALDRWARSRADVSVVAMTMPLHADVMAPDGFHPGGPVYAYCARTIAAHLAGWAAAAVPHCGQ